MKKRLEKAKRLLDGGGTQAADQVIELLKPLAATHGDSAELHHWFGKAYQLKGDLATALGLFQKALKLEIDLGHVEWDTRRQASECAFKLGDASLAESHVKESILKKPESLESWLHLAEIYRSKGELNKALATLGKANKVDPTSSEVAMKIARVYKDQGYQQKALEMLDVVIEMDNENHLARIKKADILISLREFDRADQCYQNMLELDSESVQARAGLAELSRKRGALGIAREKYEELIHEYPKISHLYGNLGVVLQQLGELDESEECYRKAIRLLSSSAAFHSNLLMGMHYNQRHSQVKIYEEHIAWAELHANPIKQLDVKILDENPDRKIRIGFLSGGFRKHPVGWMITAVVENLPKDEFELHFYSTHNGRDELTKRIHRCADSWNPVVGYTEEQIAHLIESDQIDILIELSGHAADNRLLTVARKPAPIAIKWVGGLFNTTGMESMDYLLSDHFETPVGVDDLYTEKLIRMPDDYIVFLPPDYAPDVKGLPLEENGYITFGCLNNPVKVNDELLGVWAQILNRVEESRLLLKGLGFDTEEWRNRIHEFMEQRGISRDRILMEGPERHKEFLETYNQIDIALDTWPYSGGLTTCEAMWMGVPVITKPGPTFAGRHSVTHVTNAGHPEWVSNQWEGYIDRAVALATAPKKLADIRKDLRNQVASSPLCDGDRFARNLTLALREVWRRKVRDETEVGGPGKASLDVRKLAEQGQYGVTVSKWTESESGRAWKEVATAMAGSIKPVNTREHPFEETLIVSLTSYPKRFPTLNLTLKSLLNQTIQPDKVILWVARDDREKLPPEVIQLTRDGLEIRLCEDLKSYKKLIPALEAFPDATHVTADDDIYYWPTWLEELTTCAERFPDCVIAHRVHKIATSGDGEWLPYGMWNWGEQRPFIPSTDLLPTGGAGVLYRPGVFHADVTKFELIQEVCPKADDLWFYWMARLAGAKVVSTGKANIYLFWPESQNESLWEYNGQDGNDRQISNLADRYGYPELDSSHSNPLSVNIPLAANGTEGMATIFETALSLSAKLGNPDTVNTLRKQGMAQEFRRSYITNLLDQPRLKPRSNGHKPFLKGFSQLIGEPVRSLDEACSWQLFPMGELSSREIKVPGLNEISLEGRARRLIPEIIEDSVTCTIPILHGSMADGKTTPFSDVDVTLWVDPSAFRDAELFEVVKRQRDELNLAIHQIDPVGHHGSFVQLSTDMKSYPEASMPLDVLEKGIVLRDQGCHLEFQTRNSMDSAFLTLVELCHFFWKLPDSRPPEDRFAVKQVISRFFIINLLHYELATGVFTDKRAILTDGLKQVADSQQLEVVNILSHIREGWPDDTQNAGAYLSKTLLEAMAEVSGGILSDLVGRGLFQRIEEYYLVEGG